MRKVEKRQIIKKVTAINSNQVGSILSEILKKYNDKRICHHRHIHALEKL